MPRHLAVGMEATCVAPLRLERLLMRLYVLMGARTLLLPDHYQGFVPRRVWGPAFTPAAKVVPSLDAFFDPFVMLGMMATRYRRVRIGTGVTEPIRRHPVTLAQAAVTIDHMTGGRAILGIGNGERENTEPYGLPFTKRVARLEESLEIMHRLWRSGGEPVDFDGAFWRLRQAPFTTPLYGGRPPAVWVAAHAPRMLGVTGRYATGWYPTMKLAPADYAARLSVIRKAALDAGRDFGRFEPALQIMVALGDSRDAVLEQVSRVPAAAALGMLLPGPLWARHGLRHPLGEGFEGFPDFVPEEVTDAQLAEAQRLVTPALLADGVFAGSVDEIVAEVRPLVAAGLRHVVIMNIGPMFTGAGPKELLQLGLLVRRLRRIPLVG